MGRASLRGGRLESRAVMVLKLFFLIVLQNVQLAYQLSSQLGIAFQGNLQGVIDHL